jgi:alanyl-tRNA synthetase
MSADRSTIDLAREATAAEIDRAVDEANAVVWEDRNVSIRFVSAEEADALPLRKEPAREGPLRLIEIAGFDLSACGGTHVNRTGAIGMIEATGVERVRGGSRVTFVCGGRASRAFRGLREAVAGSVRVLSVLPSELPAAVERVQAEARDLRKTITRLQTTLAGHEATRLLAEASDVHGVRLVVCTLDRWDASGLKAIAASLGARQGVAAALFSTGVPVAVVIARSPDVLVDAQAVLRTLLDRFGGRGGGKTDLAQGAGLHGAAHDLEAAARDEIQRRLTLPPASTG